MSTGTVNRLLQILAAKYVVDNLPADNHSFFRKYQDVLDAIYTIGYGEASWRTFAFRFDSPVSLDSPSWKRETFLVHCRDALRVAQNLASYLDFNTRFGYVPDEEYTSPGFLRVSN